MTPAPRIRDAWITPREEVEALPYDREVYWWELVPPEVKVTDEDYESPVLTEIRRGMG